MNNLAMIETLLTAGNLNVNRVSHTSGLSLFMFACVTADRPEIIAAMLHPSRRHIQPTISSSHHDGTTLSRQPAVPVPVPVSLSTRSKRDGGLTPLMHCFVHRRLGNAQTILTHSSSVGYILLDDLSESKETLEQVLARHPLTKNRQVDSDDVRVFLRQCRDRQKTERELQAGRSGLFWNLCFCCMCILDPMAFFEVNGGYLSPGSNSAVTTSSTSSGNRRVSMQRNDVDG
jgi:hypothetical protein